MKNTFTHNVKEEVSSLIFSDELWQPLLVGFLKNNMVVSIDSSGYKWEITSQIPKLLRFIYSGLIKFTKIKKKFYHSQSLNPNGFKTYKMIFFGNLEAIEKELKILEDSINIKNNVNSKRAFLAGLFLSGGSVNSPNSRTYHLEFRLRNKVLSNYLVKILEGFELSPKVITRKEKTIVYMKKSENISDVLKLLHANDSMLLFEDQRINKDYSNQIHRLNNLDISNLKKTIEASQKISDCIKYVISNKHIYDGLSLKEKNFCKIRLEHVDWSLEEIANYFNTILKIKISKSAINHYTRKIRKIYNESTGN